MSAQEFKGSPPIIKSGKESPHDKKGKWEWFGMFGLLAKHAFNWRRMAYLTTLLSFFLAAGLIYQSTRSQIAVHVVEIDSGTGMARAIGPIEEGNYTPREAEIKYFISQFVLKTRTMPLDPVLYKQNLDNAYALMRQNAATKINQIFQNENLIEQFGKQTVMPAIVSVISATPDTYQVRWMEDIFEINGGKKSTVHMTGLFTVEFEQPRNEKQLLVNPLGIYIKDFSWSKDQRTN